MLVSPLGFVRCWSRVGSWEEESAEAERWRENSVEDVRLWSHSEIKIPV